MPLQCTARLVEPKLQACPVRSESASLPLNAYPAVNPAAGGQVGGTETRAWLFARELAKRPELRVSLAVRTTDAI